MDAEKLERDLNDLFERIEKWKRTPLVRECVVQGVIPPGDILAEPWIKIERRRFDGIRRLPKLAWKLNTQERPGFTQRLEKICHHIHNRTGQWHDEHLSQILRMLRVSLAPYHPRVPTTGKSLENWRSDHGVVNRST